MSESRLPPVVAKELQGFYKAKKDTPKFFKKLEEEGYKMVLFQVPKDVIVIIFNPLNNSFFTA